MFVRTKFADTATDIMSNLNAMLEDLTPDIDTISRVEAGVLLSVADSINEACRDLAALAPKWYITHLDEMKKYESTPSTEPTTEPAPTL